MRADDSFGGDDKWHWFDCNAVTPGYFKTLRMPIIQGRDFTDRDNETSADVVIVNETLARRYWPGVNALGKRMRVQGFEGEKDRSCEIVGVVGDAKYSAVWQGAKPYLYFPLFQFYLHDPKLQISVFGNPSSVIGSIRKVLEPLGPDVRVDQVRLISAEMDSMLDRERSTAYVFGIFGAIALILAGVGLYGVISYFVAQRTREFGIRMALGAQPADIIRQIIREGMVLVVVGLAIGLPCSMALSRFVSSQLHGVSTADPLTYITISILCLAATLLAVLLPARRATANPMEALRFE
jgi:putative ABC transport system permease protein